MDPFLKGLGLVVFVLVLAFALSVLFAFPCMWLRNWLMPTLFGLKIINVFQAWGLLFLSGLLFKSPGSTSSSSSC